MRNIYSKTVVNIHSTDQTYCMHAIWNVVHHLLHLSSPLQVHCSTPWYPDNNWFFIFCSLALCFNKSFVVFMGHFTFVLFCYSLDMMEIYLSPNVCELSVSLNSNSITIDLRSIYICTITPILWSRWDIFQKNCHWENTVCNISISKGMIGLQKVG